MTRSRTLLLVVALLAAAAVGVGGLVTSSGRLDAESQAERFAEPLAVLCARDRQAALLADIDCPAAEQVAREGARAAANGEDGEDGRDGPAGRGVVSTRLDGDRLVVTYTDGTTEDVGRVVGPDGEPGEDGRGIAGTEIVDGALVVTFTDGESSNLGRVVGAAGRGVAGVAAAGGRLIVTFDDGQVVDAGPLPMGPQGERGPQGPAGPVCLPGFEPVRGSVVVGGVEFGRAVVCVDPSSAQSAPEPEQPPPGPSPEPDPPPAGEGTTAPGEDDPE